MTWTSRAFLALLLTACSGDDGDGAPAGSDAPYPDCASIDRNGVVQQLVRTFDDSGKLVEETLDGTSVATYTYDGDDLATKVTPDETWTLSWGADGITSIEVTDGAGTALGTYAYFYEGGQLSELVYQPLSGYVDFVLLLSFVDPLTSVSGSYEGLFAQSNLAPPISDPLRDPKGLLMLEYSVDDGVLFFERELDGDGLPAVERIYEVTPGVSTLVETRTWSYCDG